MMGSEVGVSVVLALTVLGAVMVLVWIVLPFAVIGTKPLLRELIIAQHRTNKLLEDAAREQAGKRAEVPRMDKII